ncbi:hypothetical protein BDW62DRAFT_209728 [Aspergillus aurantiobrunneus]
MTEPNKIRRTIDEEGGTTTASYPHYLPTWDPSEKYPPLTPFTHTDPGLTASPSFPDLLPPGSSIQHLTPTIGTEITGIQLSSLSPAGKDQLALLTAQRKVLVFRDQDFADLPIPDALTFASHFGRHHIHPTSGVAETHPEVHIVHRYAKDTGGLEPLLALKNTSASWHSDVTYEAQPPGTTILYVLDSPAVGGDTAFANQAEAYRRLSPAIQQRLHGLRGVHTDVDQAEYARRTGGVVRREPVSNEHPLVRTHPVTGEKALYVNGGFMRGIVGLKAEESEALMAFLLNHVSKGIDFQVRVRWAPRTVVIWDNRVTAHSAIFDWDAGERRHLARLTLQAERPFETEYVGE